MRAFRSIVSWPLPDAAVRAVRLPSRAAGASVLHSRDGSMPLAPFTAQRVDYSLARLSHYTATDATHFQNHVLFTNYQFYVDEFESYARQVLADPAAADIIMAACAATSVAAASRTGAGWATARVSAAFRKCSWRASSRKYTRWRSSKGYW